MICSKRGLSNVTIITCDINTFNIDESFDRILSIEMFEVGFLRCLHFLHAFNWELTSQVSIELYDGHSLWVSLICSLTVSSFLLIIIFTMKNIMTLRRFIVLLNLHGPNSCQCWWQSTVMNQFVNFSYNSFTIRFRCFCDILVCYGDLRQSKFVYCECEQYSWRSLMCSTWRTMRSSWRKFLHGWHLRASSSFTFLYINRCLITLRYAPRMLQVQLYFYFLIIHTWYITTSTYWRIRGYMSVLVNLETNSIKSWPWMGRLWTHTQDVCTWPLCTYRALRQNPCLATIMSSHNQMTERHEGSSCFELLTSLMRVIKLRKV